MSSASHTPSDPTASTTTAASYVRVHVGCGRASPPPAPPPPLQHSAACRWLSSRPAARTEHMLVYSEQSLFIARIVAVGNNRKQAPFCVWLHWFLCTQTFCLLHLYAGMAVQLYTISNSLQDRIHGVFHSQISTCIHKLCPVNRFALFACYNKRNLDANASTISTTNSPLITSLRPPSTDILQTTLAITLNTCTSRAALCWKQPSISVDEDGCTSMLKRVVHIHHTSFAHIPRLERCPLTHTHTHTRKFCTSL